MSREAAFTGLMVATLSPFDASGRLDLGTIRAGAQFLVDNGISALCPAGTTGEMLYLSTAEKVRIVDETCRVASGRLPVIAGIWALREREVALLGRAARDAGADAVFLPPPIYYPASDDAIVRWYAAAKQASELPVFAYNIPAYAANKISMESLERLATDGIIAGIKDSTGNADQMAELLERFGQRILVEAASDSFVSEARKLGAHGFISALANVWPKSLRRLWEGDQDLQGPLTAARTAVKKAGGIPAIKYLAELRGLPMGDSRLPCFILDDDARRELVKAFDAASEAGLE